MVADSVMGQTLKTVETRPKGAESGGGVLGRGSEPPPYQSGGLGSAVSSPSMILEHFGTSEITSERQLAFESGGGDNK